MMSDMLALADQLFYFICSAFVHFRIFSQCL